MKEFIPPGELITIQEVCCRYITEDKTGWALTTKLEVSGKVYHQVLTDVGEPRLWREQSSGDVVELEFDYHSPYVTRLPSNARLELRRLINES